MCKKALPVLAALCMLGLPAGARADTVLGFTNITNNSGIAADIGTQLSVTVSPYSGGRVLFTFENAGPDPSIIADVYFDDGSLLTIAELIDADENGGDPGVDFSFNATPGNLPSGNTIGFVTTAGFSADADPPPGTLGNGVDPGEWLGIIFELRGGQTVADVEAELLAATLRIGIHVQGIGPYSDSYVNIVPEPGTLLLGAIGFGVIAWKRRKV